MLKLSSILILTVSSCFATDMVDKKATQYQLKRFSANEKIKIEKVEIATKKALQDKGWYGYIFTITASMDNKILKAKDIIFTNGNIVATDLTNIKNGKSYKDIMKPKLTEKYYNEKHLIAGNKNAKHKIVIFSDPLCPFCIEYVPEVIRDVKANPDIYALYYYHFPLLRLHPDAKVITKAMHVADELGIKDVTYKAYVGEFHKYLQGHKNSDKKVLDAFNKILNTKITMEQINDPKVQAAINKDVFMGEESMVQGTPTVYFDGEYDNSRYKYDKVKK